MKKSKEFQNKAR